MTPSKAQLEPTWREAAVRAGVPEAETSAIFDELCRRYSEPARHYHNLTHIAQMLEIVERFRSEIHDYVAVCLAVWFHDVIYDTQRKDNEEQSADYARAVLKPWVWESLRMRVSILIWVTKDHQARPAKIDYQLFPSPVQRILLERQQRHGEFEPYRDTDRELLIDADLAILGSSPADYDQYAQAIRQEYAWVSEDDYRTGRTKVLQAFLERERLYHTEPLYKTLELPARRNLQREIEQLTA